ncbi:WecB/TagA/CpsF family glycosyltransferase [Nocardioides sp. YIM 152588]|uniref:WecB/TagA/CpsF family glycosyltransferase n=1 Tax=Nocardioides sp. YIM 152588 TaxID=3158259 RepID=UPI0032E483CB
MIAASNPHEVREPIPGQPDDQTDEWTRTVSLGGCQVALTSEAEALDTILDTALHPRSAALGVLSANLDHIHHFGTGGRWHGVLEHAEASGAVRWLTLLDGAPLVQRANALTGRRWSRLAGSDLIHPILGAAARTGLRVGFLGGSQETHGLLSRALSARYPRLVVAGSWAPERSIIDDPAASADLADTIREAGVDILVLCLGKPRQELWIAAHGARVGAPVQLAFGAVVDFLAGRIPRAPAWMSDHGLEWSYRLAREPQRLSRRYLVQGPPALHRLHRESADVTDPSRLTGDGEQPGARESRADLAAVVVTYNSARVVGELLEDLRRRSEGLRMRVVAVDNGSTDGTLELLERQGDVRVVRAGGNVGYAAGINLGTKAAGDCRAFLVLNPDIRLAPGALGAMWRRLWQPGVGAVVPHYDGGDTDDCPALRREPSVLRTLGDAVLGGHLPGRPAWLTEVDYDDASYRHPHSVDWATGACLMVRSGAAARAGLWDERFFLYSEEVDFMRRLRTTGHAIWYEPGAVVRHEQGASGSSSQLVALSAVNRVRYAEKWHGWANAQATRAAAAIGAFLRLNRPEQRVVLRALLSARARRELPQAEVSDAER